MTLHDTVQLLLAVREKSGIVWGRFDRGRSGVDTADWFVMIGATCLLVIVAVGSYWRSKRRGAQFLCDSSSRLFGELCRAHRLDHTNIRLLKKLAAERGAQNAAALFVEPQHFDLDTLPSALKASSHDFRQLRQKLFD